MIQSDLVKRAQNAFNKTYSIDILGGHPVYLCEQWCIAEQMTDEKQAAVALLYGLLGRKEDGRLSEDDLKSDFLIPDDVISAVKALEQKSNETYEQYIRRISKNDIARFVKIVEIERCIQQANISKSEEDKVSEWKKAVRYLWGFETLDPDYSFEE